MSNTLTPKQITERHLKFPDATEDLIEYYANMKVMEHMKHLIKYSAVSQVPLNNMVIIVSDWSIWDRFKGKSPFDGINVSVIENALK